MSQIPKLSQSDLERFWKYVDKQDGCWLWTGKPDRHGYGRFWLKPKDYLAHRVMISLSEGNSELQVRHLCNKSICVNPGHLRYGTSKEDSQDQRDAGTWAHGSTNGWSKLTETDIPVIRKLCKSYSQNYVAKLFGVQQSTISVIVTSTNWSHVTGVATDDEVKEFLASI